MTNTCMPTRSASYARARLIVGTLMLAGTAAIAATGVPANAQAQSNGACATAKAKPKKSPFRARFGKLMGAAGIAAVTGQKASAGAAADAALRDVVDTSREQAQQGIADAAACAGKPAGQSAPSAAAYPSQIAVPPEIEAAKLAFDEFGKVRCTDCEGGYSYDSWARQAFAGELGGKFGAWEKKLGALKAGETIAWKGSASNGTIRLIAEEKVAGFDCRRLGYRLDRGKDSASRDGLLCWGKTNQYAASDSWVEVY